MHGIAQTSAKADLQSTQDLSPDNGFEDRHIAGVNCSLKQDQGLTTCAPGYHCLTRNDTTELMGIVGRFVTCEVWCSYLKISEGTCDQIRLSRAHYSSKVLEVVEAYLKEISEPCWEDIVWILCKVSSNIKLTRELASRHDVDYQTLCGSY